MKFKSNQAGFGFLQLLMIVPVIMVIMGSAASYFHQKLTTNMQQRSRESFKIHHMNMLTDLGSPMTWSEIIRLNPEISCLETSTCSTIDRRTFIIYSISGAALSGPESKGFRTDGVPCDNLEQECPIKWHFEWRPMCDSLISCPPESEIEFVGELIEPINAQTRLNLGQYKITIYQKLF